jgi:DNA (cytosine-5)-methyltransferase 1
MRFGSVCSGIEAASVAWNPLGWEAAWLSEIEPFPCAVLKHHYPDVPNLGDMTLLPERILSGEVEAPDLFCGGTPCQAFSVAGLRNSLDDARGNLSLTFVGIANAIDHVRSVRGDSPAIVFWENVPGVLSTKDNAFGCFLAALAGESDPVTCPDGKWSTAGVVVGQTRTVAWRVLDAQYFGVAQRRRRVFVVASARTDFDPASVLFEFDGVRRDTAPSRETGKEVAGTIEASLGRSRGAGTPPAAVTTHRMVAFGEYSDDGSASAMKARDYKDATDLVAQVISIQDVRPIEKAQNGRGWNDDGTAYTVDTHATQGVAQPIAFHPTQDPISSIDGTTHGLGCGSSGGQASVAIAQPINIYGGNKRADRPEGGFYVRINEDTSKTLDAATGLNPTCSQGGTAVMQPIPFDTTQITSPANYSKPQAGDPCHPLAAGAHAPAVIQTMQVRRLTPVECERLQGFPDNYTDIKAKNKPTPDGPRYKALGNSWAVPVVNWIGQRIAQQLKD